MPSLSTGFRLSFPHSLAELALAAVERRLQSTPDLIAPVYSREETKGILDKNAADLIEILRADSQKAKQALQKAITSKLILTPCADENVGVFEVGGDISLFCNCAEHQESYCAPLIYSLAGLQLPSSSPRQ